MGIHNVVFILDLIPETTGSSVVFPFPLYPSFIPSLPFLIPPSFYSVSFSPLMFLKQTEGTRKWTLVSQRLLQTHRRGFILTHSVFSCPSLVSANEERPGGCHGNPEEAQRHGPQHRGRQGMKHLQEVCVCVCNSADL